MDSVKLRSVENQGRRAAPRPGIGALLREAGLWLEENEYAEVTVRRKGKGLFLEKRSTKVVDGE